MASAAPRLLSVNKNGVGTFVLQCRKLVFHYCERSGSSRGMNEYLRSHLVSFAKENPQIEILVTPRPSKHPVIRGFYLNGREKVVCVRNTEPHRIAETVQLLRDTSGMKVKVLKKPVISDTPSVRGIWSPFNAKPHKI
ncbi:thioredoxin-like protein [Syncephalis pseudoplumigaleata]|uniref:Large ribosomal subunit protein mL43 n=1 Tax=Syncephalis pseudoplumigaleata TaxID=1712513 RepID=A0A4P9YS96_9FUNG|nr:thioredoxin-like protein [Syncephalis pseudoplumigaleata]|eukprot:RKP22737.1 thioredoxin-like protein [Syncephalis pseudoplumigaleata]